MRGKGITGVQSQGFLWRHARRDADQTGWLDPLFRAVWFCFFAKPNSGRCAVLVAAVLVRFEKLGVGQFWGPHGSGTQRHGNWIYLGILFFDAPVPVRVVSGLAAVAIVVFGLGWVSTENLRTEAAKPTLTERVTTATGNAVDATKEKTGGWVDGVKGWFKGDDEQP
jgi:hypothetical protein